MSDTFYTIAHEGEGKYTEKMSRFLAFACYAESADEARAIVKRYQNEYHDARHVCWAYMLGADRTEWQLNDNGEPSGTAGKPILGQINSAGVTDVVVVVVRYFGGIKLGTSGLISAYREAARLALEDAGTQERHVTLTLSITFPYMSINEVMRIAKGDKAEVVNQAFDNSCTMTLRMRRDHADEVTGRLLAIDGVTLDADT